MADMLCPVCGDKVVYGKCSFCGYVLTEEEKRNAKYSSNVTGTLLNESKNASNNTLNECKGHMEHSLNDNAINANAAFNNTANNVNTTNKNNSMYVIAVVLLLVSPVVSLILCAYEIRRSNDMEYKKKMSAILVIDVIFLILGVAVSILAALAEAL